jgi:hypothetical protein
VSRLRISEAQANADALIRRGTPHAAEHRASVSVVWDWQRRAPRNLREAVRFIRQAYADEVPRRMTEGPDSIGEDGTPRFAPQAEAYIFGSGEATTGTSGEVVAFYRTPFRATLAHMEQGQEPEQKRAAIVRHVTIGSRGPKEAAIAEGVPEWCAGTVAEDAVRGFIARLSDVRIDTRTTNSGEVVAA